MSEKAPILSVSASHAHNSMMTLSFPTHPHKCSFIDFKANGTVIVLNADKLQSNAKQELSKVSQFFGCDKQSDESIFVLETNNKLHIANSGDYIRLTHDDIEFSYWDNSEFQDEGEASVVLGAIAGAMIETHNN
tara:strand:+ start:564 stop:965 length:402 start_codon:yes stop_codon:yes gene_type:complete